MRCMYGQKSMLLWVNVVILFMSFAVACTVRTLHNVSDNKNLLFLRPFYICVVYYTSLPV